MKPRITINTTEDGTFEISGASIPSFFKALILGTALMLQQSCAGNEIARCKGFSDKFSEFEGNPFKLKSLSSDDGRVTQAAGLVEKCYPLFKRHNKLGTGIAYASGRVAQDRSLLLLYNVSGISDTMLIFQFREDGTFSRSYWLGTYMLP